MKITYLFHSGFMVELDNNLFIFDYFKDNCKKNRYRDCGQLKPEDMPKDKNVYIFVAWILKNKPHELCKKSSAR